MMKTLAKIGNYYLRFITVLVGLIGFCLCLSESEGYMLTEMALKIGGGFLFGASIWTYWNLLMSAKERQDARDEDENDKKNYK